MLAVSFVGGEEAAVVVVLVVVGVELEMNGKAWSYFFSRGRRSIRNEQGGVVVVLDVVVVG